MTGKGFFLSIATAVLIAAAPVVSVADVEPPGDTRDRLTLDEMIAGVPNINGPIHNDFFLPIGEWGPAQHEFGGKVNFLGTAFIKGNGRFPSFAASFISSDGRLIPVERDIIQANSGSWDIILSAGRIWSEPGDNGWSRASFPFALVGRGENDSHNGLGTFLYNDNEISNLHFQIVQEAARWNRFDAWSQIRLIYRPGPIEDDTAIAAAFMDELKARLPTKPLSSLDSSTDVLEQMEHGFEHVTMTAMVDDGVLYIGPCHTRFGDYPYCEEMRHGVFSVTKTVGAALSLLWLAETYGPQVFDLKIIDYVDVTSDHDGWDDVTFRNAIDMATGIGELAPNRHAAYYNNSNDKDLNILPFVTAMTAEGKLDAAFLAGRYEWGPGEVVRYRRLLHRTTVGSERPCRPSP